MTILQIFSRYVDRGGEEIAIEQIGSVLSEQHEIRSCFFDNADWKKAGAPPAWRQALLTVRNPTAVAELRTRQNNASADVWLVHNVFPVGSAAIFREASRFKIPIIYYIHNFRPFSVTGYLWAGGRLAQGGLRQNFWREIYYGEWQNSRLRTAWLALVLRFTYQQGWWSSVKAWVAISDFMREQFIQAGVPARNIFTLRHPWRAMERPPKSGREGHYLYLGRLIEAKGVEVLLKAWGLLKLRLGKRAPKLVIAGEGPLANQVRSVCATDSNVQYLGHVSGQQKFDLLANCRCVIAPSLWWEPLGLITYEAYDFGKPVLAARSGGLTETVVADQTGKLHEPGNFEELARHVIELEQDLDKANTMGAHGRQWLLENADEQNWREKFNDILDYAIAARN